MKVICLGPEGSQSHLASSLLYPNEELYIVENYSDIFEELNEDTVAVIPFDNSYIDTTSNLLRKLFTAKYSINKEIYLKLNLNLVSKNKTYLDSIKRVYYPETIKPFIKEFMGFNPEYEYIPLNTMFDGINTIMYESDGSSAVICSLTSANRNNLHILRSNITPEKVFTRFVSISSELVDFPPADANKCTMVFEVQEKKNSLLKSLDILYRKGYDLIRMDSLPVSNKAFRHKYFFEILISLTTCRI